jgi:hypothetical protein
VIRAGSPVAIASATGVPSLVNSASVLLIPGEAAHFVG